MKNFLIYILFMSLFGVISSCNNDDDTPVNPTDQLPPATQTGENTFGCLVNGEPFVVSNTTNMVAIYQGGALFIVGEIDIIERDENISIFLNDANMIVEGGEYNLINSSTDSGKFENQIENCNYFTTEIHSGKLIINHFDEVNFIISGTFQFEAYSESCSNVIEITNGRFDMHYIP